MQRACLKRKIHSFYLPQIILSPPPNNYNRRGYAILFSRIPSCPSVSTAEPCVINSNPTACAHLMTQQSLINNFLPSQATISVKVTKASTVYLQGHFSQICCFLGDCKSSSFVEFSSKQQRVLAAERSEVVHSAVSVFRDDFTACLTGDFPSVR